MTTTAAAMPLDAELKEKFPRLVRGGKKALRNPIGSKIMPEDDLVCFVDAQAPVESHVIQELTEGQKRTHRMWSHFRVRGFILDSKRS